MVTCHSYCYALLSKEKTRAVIETNSLSSLLCSVLLYILATATNQTPRDWKINAVLDSITEHWLLKGLFPSLHAASICMEMGRGMAMDEMPATSGREGHYFLVTMKRFIQGLLLKYGSTSKPCFFQVPSSYL